MLADRNTKHMKLQVIYFCKMFENCKMGNLKQKVGSFETQTDKQKVNRLKNSNKTPDTFSIDQQTKGLPEKQLDFYKKKKDIANVDK